MDVFEYSKFASNSKDRVCTKDLQGREYLVCTATGVHDMIWLVDKIVR